MKRIAMVVTVLVSLARRQPQRDCGLVDIGCRGAALPTEQARHRLGMGQRGRPDRRWHHRRQLAGHLGRRRPDLRLVWRWRRLQQSLAQAVAGLRHAVGQSAQPDWAGLQLEYRHARGPGAERHQGQRNAHGRWHTVYVCPQLQAGGVERLQQLAAGLVHRSWPQLELGELGISPTPSARPTSSSSAGIMLARATAMSTLSRRPTTAPTAGRPMWCWRVRRRRVFRSRGLRILRRARRQRHATMVDRYRPA